MSDKTKDDDQMPTTFAKKWLKQLKDMPDFKQTADAADTDELKKIIVMAEGNISTIEKSKDEDIKINGAKELIKDLSEPYRSGLKYQMTKIKYAIFLLEGRGVEVSDLEA
jgi:hypothetical protein